MLPIFTPENYSNGWNLKMPNMEPENAPYATENKLPNLKFGGSVCR